MAERFRDAQYSVERRADGWLINMSAGGVSTVRLVTLDKTLGQFDAQLMDLYTMLQEHRKQK
jgi:hypothetical protein